MLRYCRQVEIFIWSLVFLKWQPYVCKLELQDQQVEDHAENIFELNCDSIGHNCHQNGAPKHLDTLLISINYTAAADQSPLNNSHNLHQTFYLKF